MSTTKRYTITSALPYANGALHLGHLAGAYLPADVYARFRRLQGHDVAFICGSDEHGAAITIRAKKEGTTPQAIIDKYHFLNKSSFDALGVSFDFYHRTSDPLHHATAQEFFKALAEKGEFIEKTNEQYYDAEFDQFLADRYITGTCPKCSHPSAFGDQCENCGSDLSPLDLIDPKSTLSGKTPVLRTTKHWYFKLDQHAAWLEEWIEKGTIDGKPHHDPNAWRKHVVGQCKSWIDGGLQPRAITRDLSWGIPVPAEGGEGKVLYVWFDAPIGYISATKAWAAENGKNWEDYWKDENTELIHFIGKDNIVFHCIVFPALLKAKGDYILPTNVPANQFLNFEGEKFSKSRGWGIEQHAYLEAFAKFPNKEDALRYALLRNLPEGKDADFRWDDFVDFHDKELADNLGNFVNRVVVLTNKYFGGSVPEVDPELLAPFYESLTSRIEAIEADLVAFNIKSATQRMMELSSFGNTYLQDVSPWKIAKENPDDPRIAESMFNCLQVVALLGMVSQLFIPFTSDKLRGLLNLPLIKAGDWTSVKAHLAANEPLVSAGHQIGEPELLFAKIHDRKDDSRLQIIEAQKAQLTAILDAEKGEEREPVKEEITFEDFTKLDLRTGTILSAQPVKKADKLLQLEVDLGFEKRTIVSGIAQHFKPEELPGQQVLVLVNLAPRKLRGVLSQGMILMGEDADGKLSFVSPKDGVGNGFVVR